MLNVQVTSRVKDLRTRKLKPKFGLNECTLQKILHCNQNNVGHIKMQTLFHRDFCAGL